MRIGWVGLGRMGFPVAHALASVGHEVTATDLDPEVEHYLSGAKIWPRLLEEPGLEKLGGLVKWAPSIGAVMADTPEVVFVAVQTPHPPGHDGTVPGQPAADFIYTYLVQAVREVVREATERGNYTTVAVVSTCLPGTTDRELRPLMSHYTQLVYTPVFIAMGTAVQDYLEPEFVLCGSDLPGYIKPIRDVFRPFPSKPTIAAMSIASAELTKMAYNTFIGFKVVYANALMELCEATGADVDDVTQALHLATKRVVSWRYLRAGGGDGGACHPRDNLALSFLAQGVGASVDPFGWVMDARSHQAGMLAAMCRDWHLRTELPITVLGKAYKAESRLVDGSAATLVWTILNGNGLNASQVDPVVDLPEDGEAVEYLQLRQPGVFLLATPHKLFLDLHYPPGSVVIDPWGLLADQRGVLVLRVGRKR